MLANKRRLELLDLLAQTEGSVDELADQTDMTVANASQHLQILRRARLVETRQEGTYVFNRLGDERVLGLWHALRDVGEARLDENPANAQVVAYCRGPYCVFSDEVVDQLRRHGRQALRLAIGFPDWEAAGLPVERGAGRAGD